MLHPIISSRRAFSLVELSIVLVILGLLVGGVLSGKSLIKSAELRSVSTEYSLYYAALQTFKGKYFVIPGDMNTATAVWGKDNAVCPGDSGTAATNGTCNGDGDGVIDYDYNYGSSQDDQPHEGVHAWQQLANAGLIEGRYDGVMTYTGGFLIYRPGGNVPRSRFSNDAVWGLFIAPISRDWAPQMNIHYLAFGSVAGTYAGRWHNLLMTPEEQWNVDTKMDDGKPYTGKLVDMVNSVIDSFNYSPNCTTSEVYATAQYNLAYTDKACIALFQAGI